MAARIVYTDNPKGNLEIERDILQAVDGELINAEERTESVPELVGDADAIIVSQYRFDANLIGRLANCKVISRTGIGIDNIDVEAATREGIPVANVPDYCIPEVSDHVMALILTLQRNTAYFSTRMEEGAWDIEPPTPMERLSEQRLGLLAFGDIPRAVAEKGAAFGMDICAHDPFLDPDEIRRHGITPVEELETLLENSDIVSVHVPLTDETTGLLGRDEFDAMKDTAILINTSRGEVVDTDELERALREGRLGGAGLDVFEREPPDRESLVGHDAVATTPHIAFKSRESERQQRRTIAWNVRTVLEGSIPRTAINSDAIESE